MDCVKLAGPCACIGDSGHGKTVLEIFLLDDAEWEVRAYTLDGLNCAAQALIIRRLNAQLEY